MIDSKLTEACTRGSRETGHHETVEYIDQHGIAIERGNWVCHDEARERDYLERRKESEEVTKIKRSSDSC